MQESNSSPVITTKRRHSAAFKRKILELTEQSGASVAAIALEHGVNANLVFKWRRAKLERKRGAGRPAGKIRANSATHPGLQLFGMATTRVCLVMVLGPNT